MKLSARGLISGFFASSIFASSIFAADWHPADGPLKTRWAKDVSANKVWPEYPRPQMVRKDWINLNGLWDYAIVSSNEPDAARYDGRILVPFPVESALSGVMKPFKADSLLVYHRKFKVPRGWHGRDILLHFGAVDWQATVFVNNKEVGVHRGGYDPFDFEIASALEGRGEQDLRVVVADPTDGGQPHGKQTLRPKGIFYTANSGIWQTVWMEPVARGGIRDLVITPDIDQKILHLTAVTGGETAGETISVAVLDHGKKIAETTGDPGADLSLSIPEPKLWSPDAPFLYDLKVSARREGKIIDAVASYAAMRKISIGKDARGITRPMLNNQPVYQAGPLDQGFWPDGIYTAPTDEALRYDLEMTKKLGFNMTRKHVKVEPDRWYYDCDKMGLLVWQDMPAGNIGQDNDRANFERELRQMILTHRNHPCIVMWVVFNEGWGQFDTERLTKMVKEMDPSRLVDDATGWTDKGVGDVIDIHKYPGPGSPPPEQNRAAVLGEFGGLGLAIPGHTWKKESWGYKGMADPDALTKTYTGLLDKALELRQNPGLSAVVYTQITDVETECNGLMTYDRAVLKPDLRAIAKANAAFVTP